jgi:hypothetical protein
MLVSSSHAIRQRSREMRSPIVDQPLITVADGHEEKVDWYHGDDLPIRTVDIAHGKERVGDRDTGLDEADPVVGERRLGTAVDGLLRLGTELLHYCGSPLKKVTPPATNRYPGHGGRNRATGRGTLFQSLSISCERGSRVILESLRPLLWTALLQLIAA